MDRDELAQLLLQISSDAEVRQKLVVQEAGECGVRASMLKACLVRQNVISMKYPAAQGI
jgi:hypothetical protein